MRRRLLLATIPFAAIGLWVSPSFASSAPPQYGMANGQNAYGDRISCVAVLAGDNVNTQTARYYVHVEVRVNSLGHLFSVVSPDWVRCSIGGGSNSVYMSGAYAASGYIYRYYGGDPGLASPSRVHVSASGLYTSCSTFGPGCYDYSVSASAG